MKVQDSKKLYNQHFYNTYPCDTTPICYDNLGNVISTFKDDTWDFSHYVYHPSSIKILKFNIFRTCQNEDLRKKIIYEFKIIIYGFIYCNTHNLKSFSIQTIINSYKNCLVKIFLLAIECNSSLSGLSKNYLLINKIFHYLTFINRQKYGAFSHLFKKLNALSITFTEHDFSLNKEQNTRLKLLKNLLKDRNIQQHLVIPSRIYLELNIFMDDLINDFNNHSVQIIELYLGFRNNKQFKKILSTTLDSEFTYKNKIHNFGNLKFYIQRIKYISLIKIIMFSGIRHSEALLLPYNCFEVIEIDERKIYTLTGYTSKFTNFGPIKASWITSPDVEESIKALKSITSLFLCTLKIDITNVDHEVIPLACYRPNRSNNSLYTHPIYKYPVTHLIPIKSILTDLNFDLKILGCDMNELERTIPFYSQEEYSDLAIGLDFPISIHQFRRSLTVYAARSGLVNFPALKAQLKHIKKDMTLYYANNTMDTVNLFDKDLSNMFNDEICLEKFSLFNNDVMNTSNKLYGGEGSRLQNAKESTSIPLFLTDEQTALQDIKNGKLSYKRTPLGGCSKVGICEDITELTITSCINCKNSIFSERTNEALKITLKSFENQLKLFPDNSPHHKHLLAEIKKIKSLINKII